MSKAEFKQWMYTYPLFNVVCPNECGDGLQNRETTSYDWTTGGEGFCGTCETDFVFDVPDPTIILRNINEQIKRGVY